MLLKKKKKKKEESFIIQENPDECVKLVNTCFGKYLSKDSITDISFNGKDFYACDNHIGRYKLDINYSNDEMVVFVKKIANYMLSQFSSKSMSVDVAFGDYRLNAVHPSYARDNNKKVITFSLRKITASVKITKNDPLLCPIEVHNLLKALMISYESILISGQTGSGKTEFQKYLISLMNDSDRIILIEESYETHIKDIYKDMDITSWIVDNQRDELSNLVRLALRNNPDWLIVAETRGKEAYDMVNAIMTGHSAITTIHSESAKYSLDRIANIIKKDFDIDEDNLLSNMAKHIKIGIHLEKVYDKNLSLIVRRISEVIEYIPTKDGYSYNSLYELSKNEKLVTSHKYGNISSSLKKSLIKHDVDLSTIKKFISGEKNEEKNK